jgi:predicted RNA binding protein with dsRBD fold (UPF0201 family)
LIARAGKVSEKNAQAVSLAARLASEVVDESMNAEQWAHAISEAAEDPEALASLVDILRNTRLLREARTTVEQSVSVREAVELAVERQVSRVYTRDGQIIGDKERADLANQLKQCIFKR